MTTGDLKNNLRKLQAALKQVNYEKDLDYESLAKGVPAGFLSIYHHVFLDYSRPLAEAIAEGNIDLFGKTDVRFIEGLYKLLRDMFDYKPQLTKDQFFSTSFGERKIIMCTEVVTLAYQKHRSLSHKSTHRPAINTKRASLAPGPAAASSTTTKSQVTIHPYSVKEGAAGKSSSKDTAKLDRPKSRTGTHQSGSSGGTNRRFPPASRSAGPDIPRQGAAGSHHHAAQAAPPSGGTGEAGMVQPPVSQSTRVPYNSQAYADEDPLVRASDPNLRRVSSSGSSLPPLLDEEINISGASQFDARVERHMPPLEHHPLAVQGASLAETSQHLPAAASSSALDSSDAIAIHLMAIQQGIRPRFDDMCQRMDRMEGRIDLMEKSFAARLDQMETRMNMVEGLVSYIQKEQQGAQASNLLPTIETLTAKLTLLEHRLMLVEQQQQTRVVRGPSTAVTGSRQNGTYHVANGHNQDKKMPQPALADSDLTPTMTDMTEVSSSSDIIQPSPIEKASENGHHKTGSSTMDNNLTDLNAEEKCSSTPNETKMDTASALNEHFGSTTKKTAKRVYDMLLDTKKALNLPLDTPTKPRGPARQDLDS